MNESRSHDESVGGIVMQPREVERANGETACLVDVPRWDFHWQMLYFHEQGLTVSPGDTVTMRCTYDTRSRDKNTKWGEGTLDEMCVAGLFVIP